MRALLSAVTLALVSCSSGPAAPPPVPAVPGRPAPAPIVTTEPPPSEPAIEVVEPPPVVDLLRRARARVALGPLAEPNVSPAAVFERSVGGAPMPCLLRGSHGGPRIEIDLPDGAHVRRALVRFLGDGPSAIGSEIDGEAGPTGTPGALAGEIEVVIAREAHRVVLLPELGHERMCLHELTLEGTAPTTFDRDRVPPVGSLPVLAAPASPLTVLDAAAPGPATDARAPLGAVRLRSTDGVTLTYEVALARMARDRSGRPLVGTGSALEAPEDPLSPEAYAPLVPWEERWSEATARHHEICGGERRRLVLSRSTGTPAERVERTLAEVCAVVALDLAARDEDGDGAPELVLSVRTASDGEGSERHWVIDAGTFFVERATLGTGVRSGVRTEVTATESAGPPREVRLVTGADAVIDVYTYDPALDGYARTARIDATRPWEREEPSEHPLLHALRISSAERATGGPPGWARDAARGTADGRAVAIANAIVDTLAHAQGEALGRLADPSYAARWAALPPLHDAAAIEQASAIEREVIALVTGACESIDTCPRPPVGAARVATEASGGVGGASEIAGFVSATERALSNFAEADEDFDEAAVRQALFRAAAAAAVP